MNRARTFLRQYFLEWYPRAPSVVAVRVMLVFTLALVGFAFRSSVSYTGQPGGSPGRALAVHLAKRGIVADEGSLHWIEPPGRGLFADLGTHRVLFLAGTSQDPLRDFYMARVRLTPDGRVAQARLWNLSRTPFCGERGLWARGSVAAVAGTVVEGFSNVAFYDFRGEGRGLTRSLSAVDKIKNAVTNYQKTGQARGTGLAFLEFTRPQEHLDIEMSDATLIVRFDDGSLKVRVKPEGFSPDGAHDEGAFEFHPAEKAVSGHVAWIVDTARASDLVGKDKIGWAEAKFYRIADFFKRGFYGLAGGKYTVNSIREEMGDVKEDGKTLKQFFAEIKGSALPDLTPPPMAPIVSSDAMEGEGLWQPVLDAIFNLRDRQAPPSLYRTFIRPDPERPFAHANLVAWDARMVELHVSAGAVEPKSETGRAGTGMIPRDGETMQRLLAGFNGGFQALHGEFGLMQEGKIYLPPKPWAATVAVLRGGKIGFGTWPGPEAGEVPPEIVSYRQNLTPLIMDSEINPYKRRWWGSSPDLNPDSPSIARSGICWTESDHIVYALAYSVNEVTFANMMKHAGCHYLIQLDVNAGHSGFEFIRVTPEDKTPPLPESLDGEWEAEGKVPGKEGFVFRSKKLFKNMALMRFPRYIGKEPRDFFYITLKRNLPGDPVAPGPGDADDWTVAGLPGNAYPPSFALTTLHPEARTARRRPACPPLDPEGERVRHAGMVRGRRGEGDPVRVRCPRRGVERRGEAMEPGRRREVEQDHRREHSAGKRRARGRGHRHRAPPLPYLGRKPGRRHGRAHRRARARGRHGGDQGPGRAGRARGLVLRARRRGRDLDHADIRTPGPGARPVSHHLRPHLEGEHREAFPGHEGGAAQGLEPSPGQADPLLQARAGGRGRGGRRHPGRRGRRIDP
jgi:hypothetical protein